MTYLNVFFLSCSLLISFTMHSMDIVEHQSNDVQKRTLTALMFKGALQAPQSLKKHNPTLLHHDGQFQVVHKGKLSKIPSLNIKGLKAKLSTKQLKGFVENGGYFWLSKDSNDDFCLEAKMRLVGGNNYLRRRGANQYAASSGGGLAGFIVGTGASW